MKKFAKLLCLILALTLVVSLCACGSSGKSGKDDDDEEESIAGTYVLTGLAEDGEELDPDEMGMSGITLVINEDGTAEMSMGGYVQELVWKNGKIWNPDEEEPEKVKMSVNGSKLTLENDGQEMIFTKQKKADKESTKNPTKNPVQQQPGVEALNIYGTYYFSYMEEDGYKVTASDMEAGGVDPDSMYVSIDEDGTGTLCMYGETMDMEWGNGQIWPVDEPDEPVSLAFDGFTLTMEQDGQKIVFEK